MTNSIRKKILTLVVVFIIMLLMTGIYLHVYPESEIFKELEDENYQGIKNDNFADDNINDIDSDTYDSEESGTNDVIYTIVTGASKNHFCPLKSFLYAIHETIKASNKKSRIIVYDLGLSNKQNKEIKHLLNQGYLAELRLFNWQNYPSFWNISIARGEYGWKPGMVHEVSQQYPGVIIWLDSGTKVEKKFFDNIDIFLNDNNGFISPSSPGLMVNWTHPGVYDYFHDDHTKYDNLPNCNGASIAFDTERTQSLIDTWYKCALEKDCIAPPGSSRKNHRQDQTLLTYFAAREGRICNETRGHFGFQIHDDGQCKEEIFQYENEHQNLKYIN